MAEHRINMTANFSQFDAEIKKAIGELKYFGTIASSSAGDSDKALAKFTRSLDYLNSNATTTKQRMNTMFTLMKEMELEYERMGEKGRNSAFGQGLQKNIERINKSLSRTKELMAKVNTTDTYGSATVDAGGDGGDVKVSKSKTLFTSILGGNLAARLVMDSVRAMGRVIKDAVKTNAEFEYSNATLAAVLNKTTSEITNLTMQARKLGSTSLYSAKEITELQVSLARLGFNQEEINDSTAAISKLAIATGVDLAKAADLTGSTLRAFGYSTKEASRVASVLGVVTTKSALDMSKLSVAMGYASAVSRQAGFEIEEVAAMLGKLADNGIQASTMGVNVRNIMLDLTSKTSKLSKAIKQVTGRDNIRSFAEFSAALRKMRDAGMNLDDVGAMMQRRVTTGFLNMVANAEGIEELTESLRNCTGELDVMAEKMENTVVGASKKFGNAWDSLMLTFSNSNGTIKDLIVSFTNLINKYTEWRSMRQGGDVAMSYLENGGNEEQAQARFKQLRDQGLSNEQILDTLAKERQSLVNKEYNKTQDYNYYVGRQNNGFGGGGIWSVPAYNFGRMVGAPDIWKPIRDAWNAQDSTNTLLPVIADIRDQIATLDLAMSKAGGGVLVDNSKKSIDISGNIGIGIRDMLKASKSDVENALAKYTLELQKAGIDLENGTITKKAYDKRIYSAMEAVYDAYGRTIAAAADPEAKKKLNKIFYAEQEQIDKEFEDGKITGAEFNERLKALNAEYAKLFEIINTAKYKDEFNVWVENLKRQAKIVAESELDDKVNQAKKKYEKAVSKAALKYENQDGLDYAKAMLNASVDLATFYEELAAEDPERWKAAYDEMVAAVKKWTAQVNKLGETTSRQKLDEKIYKRLTKYVNKPGIGFDAVGMTGVQDKINLGEAIDWKSIIDKLNQYLASESLYINVDLESGNIEEIKFSLMKAIDQVGDKLSALSTVVNSVDNIKQSFESLGETLTSDADAWDKFFAVINTGFTVLQTFIDVMKAVETLKQFDILLSDAQTAANMETSASSLGNAIAKKAEAGAYQSSANAKMMDAGATVISKNAILGMAGIALSVATIAAMIAAISSMRGAGNYAEGGIVPGNSMQGDKLIAHVNSGEGILTRKGVDNLGRLYNGQYGGGGAIEVYGKISGKDILIASNNYNRSRGGSRGAYTKIK